MSNFFIEYVDENPVITGKDANHIINSLRMKCGEHITVNDTVGTTYECTISDIRDDSVFLKIENKHICFTEPSVQITLYQGLVKGSKSDLIIQKCVEIGVSKIIFVPMDRSIAKIDKNSVNKKVGRWNKISQSAAEQSGRGIIPTVEFCNKFDGAINSAHKSDLAIFFYELYGEKLDSNLISKQTKTISMFIGPEGGFSADESSKFTDNGITPVTLGKRILRTETAPIVATSLIMYITENI